MIIHVDNQVLEYENNKDNIDKMLQEIDILISNNSKILNYMVIDGLEVYDAFYDYFLENIRDIEKVEVITQTYKELVNSILISTMDYVGRTPSKIEELANSFYKSPNMKAWNDLNDLLGGISWIINTFISIDQDKRLKDVVASYENWNLYAKEVFELKDLLVDFEEALLNEDNVTTADILSYEITPLFKKMEDKLQDLVKLEGQIK